MKNKSGIFDEWNKKYGNTSTGASQQAEEKPKKADTKQVSTERTDSGSMFDEWNRKYGGSNLRKTTGSTTKPSTVSTKPSTTQSASPVKTTAQLLEESQKAYDDYMKSDERKANQGKAATKAVEEQRSLNWAFGGLGAPTVNVVDEKEKELKATVEYYRAQLEKEEDQKVMDTDEEELSNWSEEDREALELYATNRNRDANAPIELTSNPFYKTAEQEASGLIQKYGKKKVDELAETFMRSENQKAAQQVTEAAQEGAGGSVGGAVGHSAASVGANLAGGLTGLLGYMQELGQRSGRYKTLDPNNAGTLLNTYSDAVRGEVAQNIAGDEYDENGEKVKEGGLGRELLSYGYQGLMAAADSIAQATVAGAPGGAALAATGSFSRAVSDASKQGATPTQAVIQGVATAGIEALSEEIPLDNLIKTAKGGKQGWEQILKNAFAQAGVEATTEEISLFGSLLAEAAILQEKSGYNREIADLVANGMSYEEAKAQASKSIFDEAVQTAIVSAASGEMSSVGAGVFANLTAPVDTQTIQQPQTAPQDVEAAAPSQPEAEAHAPAAVTVPNLVDETVSRFKETGAITNKMAETILADPAAVRQLQEQTGVEITGTKSQMRDAVKVAVRNMVDGDVALTKEGSDALVAEMWQGNQEQAEEEGLNQQGDMLYGNVPEEFLDSDESKKTVKGEGGLLNEDGTPFEAMGAASHDFAGTAAYDDLLSDTNAQRDRRDDVRIVEVPKVDADGRNVSEFVGNAYGSALTPDSFIPTIRKLVVDGGLSHDVQTNEKSLELAAQDIATDGLYRSVQSVHDTAQAGKTSANDVAKATLLYQYLTDEIDQQYNASDGKVDSDLEKMAADVFTSLSQLATNSGRSTQLFSMFRQLTPDGQLATIQNEIARYTARMKRSGSLDRNFVPETDNALFQEYRDVADANRRAKTPEEQAETGKRMRDAQNAIYKNVAAQIPSDFKAKWDAWRYMAMLGNAKTQVRNFAGNLAFKPYVEAKRIMGAAFEKLLPMDKRTKAVVGVLTESDRQLRKWAKDDAKSDTVADALKYSAKLGDDVGYSIIEENRRIFDSDILEKARKITEVMPAKGDMLFKNAEYSKALAGFVKARGYTAADIAAGKVSEAVLNEGRAYAINEAMKSTFNDCNAFSDFLANELRYKGDNIFGKAANTMAEGVLPFRRTPANIVVRMTEYSPAGIAKGLWNAATKVHNGEMSAATAVDQLAAGLTGTGAMVLGYFLANGAFGIKLQGGEVSEDEERQGHQDYAIEFSFGGQEYSYKIDWAAPANMPLFVGANIYSLVQGNGEDTSVSAFTSAIYTMGTMFEPMLSLSCMSSLNDLVEGVRYAGEGEALYTIAAQMATSYFTQGIPSLARQTVQAFQQTKQSTFANSCDPLIRDIQRTVAGIPIVGSAFQTDAVDEWGQTEDKGGFLLRAFNSYINPGTMKAIDNSALEQEITRLGESQPESVSPPSVSKTISFTDADGERHSNRRLTEEEYKTLATVQGQTAKSILDSMIESDSYKALTDEQKVKVFDYVYDYAREKGRTEAIDGYVGMDSWMGEIEGKSAKEQAKYIVKKSMTTSFSNAFSDITEAWNNNSDPAEAVESLKQVFQVYDNMSLTEKNAYRKEAGGRLGYFLEAKSMGVKTETFVDLYKTFYDIDKDTSISTSDKAEEWAYTLEKAQESRKITERQKDALKDSMVYYQMFPAQTEKFDQMTEEGIPADTAKKIGSLLDGIVGTGSINKETGKASVRDIDTREAIAKSGLSDSEIDTIMKVYMSDTGNTELKYDTIRDMGFTPEEYADSYRAYLDATGKYNKIAAIQKELGCSESVARTLYKIYYGNYFK